MIDVSLIQDLTACCWMSYESDRDAFVVWITSRAVISEEDDQFKSCFDFLNLGREVWTEIKFGGRRGKGSIGGHKTRHL